MSTTVDRPEQDEFCDFDSAHAEPAGRLVDLVDQYATAEFLPSATWITRLSLTRPRRDVRCLGPATRFWKRILDVVVSAAMLVILTPVLLLVALAVRLTSPGPVIFRQVRVGLNLRGEPGPDRRQQPHQSPHGEDRRCGADRRRMSNFGRPFVLYKFRTMRIDAEKNGAQFASKGDPRVTPIGRFLRKTRLDELPQLINVLRGEMSLVGPRPERPEFIQQLTSEIPDYLQRLGLQPGLPDRLRSSTDTTTTSTASAARSRSICSICRTAACGTISKFCSAPSAWS